MLRIFWVHYMSKTLGTLKKLLNQCFSPPPSSPSSVWQSLGCWPAPGVGKCPQKGSMLQHALAAHHAWVWDARLLHLTHKPSPRGGDGARQSSWKGPRSHGIRQGQANVTGNVPHWMETLLCKRRKGTAEQLPCTRGTLLLLRCFHMFNWSSVCRYPRVVGGHS